MFWRTTSLLLGFLIYLPDLIIWLVNGSERRRDELSNAIRSLDTMTERPAPPTSEGG